LTVSTNSHFTDCVHSKSTCIYIKRTQFQQEGRRVFDMGEGTSHA
jgi:hypothetical protein